MHLPSQSLARAQTTWEVKFFALLNNLAIYTSFEIKIQSYHASPNISNSLAFEAQHIAKSDAKRSEKLLTKLECSDQYFYSSMFLCMHEFMKNSIESAYWVQICSSDRNRYENIVDAESFLILHLYLVSSWEKAIDDFESFNLYCSSAIIRRFVSLD